MSTVPKKVKDCENESCQWSALGQMTTLLGWTPTYDKQGNLLNSNPNTITTEYECRTCNSRWREKSKD